MKKGFSCLFRHFKKADIISSLIVSFSIALIMGLINPLEIMVVNSGDFFVPVSDGLRCLWTPALLIFIAVLLTLFAALMIHKAAFEILRSVFLGVTVSSYCQELFLNGKMAVGDNGALIGEISDIELSANFLIHFAIISVFIIIAASKFMPIRKQEPAKADTQVPNAASRFFSQHIAVYLFLCITVMKAVGFSSTYFAKNNNDTGSAAHNIPNSAFFSYDPTASFSGNGNNIYVFIVDMLDTFWCDDLLELYPEVRDEMAGFTFYQNNTALYSHTFPSVCCMLTDTQYKHNALDQDYFDMIWKEENTLSVLKENGYQVNLILDESYSFGNSTVIKPFCDNYVTPEDLEQELNKKILRRILYNLSFSRTTPYFIKMEIPDELSAVSNVDYVTLSCKEQENTTPAIINTNSDTHLYEYLQAAEFNADCENNVLTIIHLNGAHDENEQLTEKTAFDKGDLLQKTLRANFEMILKYIRSARELGVYDRTTFIILGDHGQRSGVYDENQALISPTLPALLIKPANAEQIPFRYDRYTGLSHEMFMASVLEYAGIDHQKHGCSYQDIEKSQQIITRDFFWLKGIPKHYLITGDARDFSNWKLVE